MQTYLTKKKKKEVKGRKFLLFLQNSEIRLLEPDSNTNAEGRTVGIGIRIKIKNEET